MCRTFGTALLFVAFMTGTTTMAAKKETTWGSGVSPLGTNTWGSGVSPLDAKDGTGNLSKRRRDDLIKKIDAIRSFLAQSTDTNATRLLQFAAELEREVKTKKYGLVFEEHKERVDVELENNLPVLTEDKKRFIDNGGELNFLIEGDNLAALKLLEKTHKGKIDLIYIDPPYNTGNKDFVYNDSYVDANDTFRHSKWLSFMKKRLEIARRLLSKKGVLFVSIDDHEQAALKLLCDGIFGDENFVATLPRVTKKSGKDHASFVGLNHDYVAIYVKDKSSVSFKREEACSDDYKEKDEFFDDRGPYKLNQTLDYDSLWYNPAMDFKLEVNGEEFYPGGDVAAHIRRHKGVHNPKDWVWRWSEAKFKFGLKNGFVVIKEGKGRRRIYTKTYLNAKIAKKGKTYYIARIDRDQIVSSISLIDNTFSNDNAKKELGAILSKNAFDFPKPTTLIGFLMELASNEKVVVLDFFAGSGTTGHAVMKLNAEDGGKRKFILVTNNENGICEKVTYERLKRVIKKEDYTARLKYLKVDYVPITQKVYEEYADDLLRHIRELVELENGLDFDHDKSIVITVTKDEFDDFVDDENRLKDCKAVYVGHDVLVGARAKRALVKHHVELRVIPEYYYEEN